MLTSAFGFKDVPGNSCRSIAPFPSCRPVRYWNRISRRGRYHLPERGDSWVDYSREHLGGSRDRNGCRSGMYVLAVSGTALTLIVLAALKKVENRWFKERRSSVLTLRIDPSVMSLSQICAEVEGQGIKWSKLR